MMRELVPMSSSDLSDEDIRAVMEVLKRGRLALGPAAREFEERIAHYVGATHAVAVSSGTAALHLIVKALGLGPGDEVLVPSFTFAASVNVLLYEGVTPVFVDIEPETYNLDPQCLEEKLSSRTKGIMVVDVFGHPAEWESIRRFAKKHLLAVIDDSCEALGASYRDQMVGQFGDAAAFAFYPNKQMTTGEGGMVVTNSDTIAQLARSLRNQGRGEMGGWLAHERLGFNYRMDEMSAALGVSQMNRIGAFLVKREKVAEMYTARLSGLEWVRTPVVRKDVRMSWFVYVIRLGDALRRDDIMRFMAEQGIPTRAYFPPMHLQPYVRQRFGDLEGTLPVTEWVSGQTLALPFHNELTDGQVDRVVETLQEAIREVG